MSEANALFTLDGCDLIIQCSKEDKMRDICQKYATKVNENINSLLFLYGGSRINFELKFKEQANSIDKKNNKMSILVYKIENDDFICPKCGEKLHLNVTKINEIILSNNNIKDAINGIKYNIENIIKNSLVNLVNIQLKNINTLLNSVNEDINKNNEKLGKLLNEHKNYINKVSQNKNVIKGILDSNKKDVSNIKTINSNKLSSSINIDIIIEKLLAARDYRPGKKVDLREEEIQFIIDKSFPIIKEQNILVELEAPLNICGDIHGQYNDLLRIFEHFGYPGKYNFLFLGNYVDFGKQSLEVICLLLCYKIKYPNKITLLRGNHESSVTNRIYGFYDECKMRYNLKIWRAFTELFNYLPIASLINDKILCVHGGLSPDLKTIEDINNIVRPTEVPDTGLLCDLLNSDPDIKTLGYDENNKGISVIFGEKVVLDFIKKNDIDLIVRGNQVVDNGYEFFANQKLITIFSAPNFRGEYDNSAAILVVDENLLCSFKVLRPI